jgi:hypothetical protein
VVLDAVAPMMYLNAVGSSPWSASHGPRLRHFQTPTTNRDEGLGSSSCDRARDGQRHSRSLIDCNDADLKIVFLELCIQGQFAIPAVCSSQ